MKHGGMNVSVPCRLTCDPSGLNDCVNINTGILYSQVEVCNLIQFNYLSRFSSVCGGKTILNPIEILSSSSGL